ncbi:MAG: hypothetical protein NTX64_18345, partial [Elusimicrobia bacterium]|nr:hypothetical protein [Elusimicrobiota bacterium]
WCDYKPHCAVFRDMYSAPTAEAPAAATLLTAVPPSPPSNEQDELARLVDRYGDLMAALQRDQEEARRLAAEIASRLARKGYVRAFGSRFEVRPVESEVRWDFADRTKVVEVLKRHGLYDRVLKPSAPEVYRLLAGSELSEAARREIEALGERKELPALSLRPLT